MVTGTDTQTQCVIEAGILPALLEVLQSPENDSIAKEVCWTVSNIAAGDFNQIEVTSRAKNNCDTIRPSQTLTSYR